jgi:hypothetical protein
MKAIKFRGEFQEPSLALIKDGGGKLCQVASQSLIGLARDAAKPYLF